MGFFQDVFDQFDKMAQPWKLKKSDIQNSKIGQPLHALKLMESAFRTTDPIRQTVHTFRNIRDHGLIEGMKIDVHEKGHQNEQWVKDNKAAIIAVATYGIGSYLGAATSAGGQGASAAGDVASTGADVVTTGGAVGDAAATGIADVGTSAATGIGEVGATGLGETATLAPVVVTGSSAGGGLAGASVGSGIAGNAGMNYVNRNTANEQAIKEGDQQAIDQGNTAAQNSNPGVDPVAKPVINSEGGGLLSKAGNLLESKTGQTLIGMGGNMLVGAAQGNQQQAQIDANTARYTYNANQWRDPSQLDQLKQAVVAGPNIGAGYLDRAKRVSDFLNSRQIAAPQAIDPKVTYGTDVRGY